MLHSRLNRIFRDRLIIRHMAILVFSYVRSHFRVGTQGKFRSVNRRLSRATMTIRDRDQILHLFDRADSEYVIRPRVRSYIRRTQRQRNNAKASQRRRQINEIVREFSSHVFRISRNKVSLLLRHDPGYSTFVRVVSTKFHQSHRS